ncbi:hypothetical protein ABZ402_48445 [Streptomyces mirabilis]|uniref:hypothetical protein n=1 Tax=Streptomyces mirabilis TaxID=68239 RepID=UPI0033F93B63
MSGPNTTPAKIKYWRPWGLPRRYPTYDTGQATRARTTGLPVRKLAGDQGTGTEPDWAAEESRPGTGVRAQRRAQATTAGRE